MKPPCTVTMQGRQCGKTMALDIARNMESSIFALRREKDIIPDHVDVGLATHQALKTLPNIYDHTHPAETTPDKFMGIPVKISTSPHMPENGWAFIGPRGEVLAAGTIKGMKDA